MTSAWVARVVLGGADGGIRLRRAPDCASPSYATRGLLTAVFGGLLHNRADLVRELSIGSPIVSDADVVLSAYERWGRECPNHIRGICAFVIWDGAREVAFGARDRLGLFPVFWAWSAGDLLVSSSIGALVADPKVSGVLNRPAMVDHLRHTWGNHPTETFYEAVHRMPAGHAFEARRGRVESWIYWDVLRNDAEVDWLKASDAEEFGARFDAAVSRCVELGPSAIFLSGGIDSVSVAASALDITRSCNWPVPVALSLGFPQQECNEERMQRSVAATLGLPHVLLPFEQTVEPDGMVWSGLMLGRELDAPLSNGWAPAYYELRRQARQAGCDVIMTGSGGDDWLCPTPMYIADLLRRFDVPGLFEVVRNHLRSYDRPALSMIKRVLWGYGARPLLTSYARRAMKVAAPGILGAHRRRHLQAVTAAWLAPDPGLREELRRRLDQVEAALTRQPEPTGKYGFYLSDGASGLLRPLNAMEFEESFELSRKTGTLELAPYWDADLVEFLNRIPPEVLDRGGRSKGLVRETLARRFPQLGFDRQVKVSALQYFGSILETQGLAAWKRLGGPRKLVELGVVGRELDAAAPDQLTKPGGGPIKRIVQMHRVLDVMHLESWVRSRAA